MDARYNALKQQIIELNELINGVATISEANDSELQKSIEALKQRIPTIVFAPTIAIAAIVVALDKKGVLDRSEVIATMDGLVASLTPPGSNKDAALLIELIINFLRREAEGTLGDTW